MFVWCSGVRESVLQSKGLDSSTKGIAGLCESLREREEVCEEALRAMYAQLGHLTYQARYYHSINGTPFHVLGLVVSACCGGRNVSVNYCTVYMPGMSCAAQPYSSQYHCTPPTSTPTPHIPGLDDASQAGWKETEKDVKLRALSLAMPAATQVKVKHYDALKEELTGDIFGYDCGVLSDAYRYLKVHLYANYTVSEPVGPLKSSLTWNQVSRPELRMPHVCRTTNGAR